MAKKKAHSSEGPKISVGGNVGGSVIVGDHNIQVDSSGSGSRVIVSTGGVFSTQQQSALARQGTKEEIEGLSALFRELDSRISEEAPESTLAIASEKADEIKDQVSSEKPDVSMLAQAREWFVENLPVVLGTVTGILTHPLVGKMVEAAGEFTLGQFRQYLGLPVEM